MKMKPLSNEQLRILSAAASGRLRMDDRTFRYTIDGEGPPNRREREKLQKRGLLTRWSPGERIVTDAGIAALESAPISDAPSPNPEQTELALPASVPPSEHPKGEKR